MTNDAAPPSTTDTRPPGRPGYEPTGAPRFGGTGRRSRLAESTARATVPWYRFGTAQMQTPWKGETHQTRTYTVRNQARKL
jgi:hypothetical protein